MVKRHESAAFNSEQVKQLKILVAKGEGQTLEFKRKAAHPEKIIREMIAFANTSGGILLIGVSDDGGIPGLKFPEDESHVLRKALNACKPALKFRETFIPIGNARTVLQYEIPESRQKLHYIIAPGNVHESFVRVDDKSIRASREVREILKQSRRKKGVRFHYGEHEQFLMRYLNSKPYITLQEFAEHSKLKKFMASRKLVLLVLANVLRITPHEKGDLYSMALSASGS